MKRTFILFSVILIAVSCTEEVVGTSVNVIPQPVSVEVYNGELNIAGASFSVDPGLGEKAMDAVASFKYLLETSSAIPSGSSDVEIKFRLDENLADEAYSVDVRKNKVTVRASEYRGILYALETLKQMLPAGIYTGTGAEGDSWVLPNMTIKDKPRFSYRGMHLDVSRHFFGTEEIKRYLDIMAIHKLNVFHWHLTDDQGWRLEIKRYPELTKVGSVRKKTIVGHIRNSDKYDFTPYGAGCYYTQEQVREIIDYAAKKGIEVIPEIDLPGHMLAALATFPNLGCTGGPYEVWGDWGISEDVLCVGKEETMTFLENVLAEVAELFPSEYVHIGGDECPKVRWESCPVCQAKIKELGLKDDEEHSAEHYLQSYVTKRMGSFLGTKGKKIIGWDEILEGDIAPDATVMSWRGVEGGREAIRLGHDVIMVPTSHFYFDYYQSENIKEEPLGIGGYLPVEQVYSFEPVTADMSEQEQSHILGVQANLWTEYISTPQHLEYMLLPRLAALSEVQWCEPSGKNYGRFVENMFRMSSVYDILGYNYAKHIFRNPGN